MQAAERGTQPRRAAARAYQTFKNHDDYLSDSPLDSADEEERQVLHKNNMHLDVNPVITQDITYNYIYKYLLHYSPLESELQTEYPVPFQGPSTRQVLHLDRKSME